MHPTNIYIYIYMREKEGYCMRIFSLNKNENDEVYL